MSKVRTKAFLRTALNIGPWTLDQGLRPKKYLHFVKRLLGPEYFITFSIASHLSGRKQFWGHFLHLGLGSRGHSTLMMMAYFSSFEHSEHSLAPSSMRTGTRWYRKLYRSLFRSLWWLRQYMDMNFWSLSASAWNSGLIFRSWTESFISNCSSIF